MIDFRKTAMCTNLHTRMASRRLTALYDEALQPTGLKVTQFSVLMFIAESSGQSISHTAERMELDRTSLSRALQPLQKKGLVKIEKAPSGNGQLVFITTAGQKTANEGYALWLECQHKIRDSLGRQDFKTLIRLLDRVGRLQ